jgi:hypothetical protein
MALLLEVPAADGAVLIVEVDDEDIPEDLVLASPAVGEVAAKATRSLAESLDQLEPLLTAVRERLVASSSAGRPASFWPRAPRR